MGINAGALDREVTIQQLTEVKASTGFAQEDWAELAVEWMAREDMRAAEAFKEGQLSASQQTRWRLYYRDDMNPETVDVVKRRRLVFGGRIFDITGGRLLGLEDGIVLDTLARVS